MNILAITLPSIGTLVATLIYVAIVGVICWAIYRLLLYFGVSIPEPARIIFWALVCIALIVVFAHLFGILVS